MSCKQLVSYQESHDRVAARALRVAAALRAASRLLRVFAAFRPGAAAFAGNSCFPSSRSTSHLYCG